MQSRQLHPAAHRRPLLVPLLVLAALVLAAGPGHAFLVSGTVRNAQGQGLAGIDIDAENAVTGESVALTGDGTNASGFYDIFLPPGTYHISFTPPLGMQVAGREIRNVVVMGQVVLNTTLPDGFFIFGTVRDPALQPLAAVDIDVRDQATDAKIFTSHDDTDVNGFYSIVLVPGTYKVLFRPRPALSLPVRVVENVVMSQDRNVDCTLQNGVRLFGTALDPEGDPLPGVSLSVRNAATGARVWIYGSNSDPLGFYEAALLPGLYYDLTYSAPASWGYADVLVDSLLIAAATARNVQFQFPLRLTGRVRQAANGLPVPGVKIDVTQQPAGVQLPLSSNTTDANGNYSVRVPAGTFDVTFRSPEGNGLASSIVRNFVISDDAQLDAQLPAGLVLTGRVRRPGGTGVANVDFDIKDPLTHLDVPVFDDDTDALGDYTLVLPAGTYDLDLDPGRGVRLVAQVLLGVTVPHVGALDFQLQSGVLLSGRVIDHISNPWPDIDLDVRLPGTLNQIVTPGDDTDANGHYVVTIPPGTYDLVFTPPLGIPVIGRTYPNVIVSGDLVFDALLTSTIIGVEDPAAAPAAALVLEPSRPNPFNPSTRIAFTTGGAGPVTLRIYDVVGRQVCTLLAGPVAAGRHELTWDGRDARGGASASGVYFLRLESNGNAHTQKLVLAR